MSAFLCSSYHIGRLAAYIEAHDGERVRYFVEPLAPADRVGQIAARLAVANVASVQGRYPDTVENFESAPGLISDSAEGVLGYISKCAEAARTEWRGDHRAVDIEQAVRCYEYQSCEYDGWEGSDGAKLANMAYRTAVRAILEGNDADGWELDEDRSGRPAGIPLSELWK